MRKALDGKVEIRTGCPVLSFLHEEGQIKGVMLADGRTIHGKFVVAAPGRVGAHWMRKEAESLGLNTTVSPVDIGVRVELPAAVLKKITDVTYEPKLIYYSKTFDDNYDATNSEQAQRQA